MKIFGWRNDEVRKKQNIKYPYASALKTVQKDIYNYLKENPWNVKQGYEHEVSQFAKKAILHPTKSYDFIEAVDSLLKEGDYLYARTIVEEISYIAENIKKAIGKSTFNNKCSALKQFRKYLETDLSGLKVTGTYNNHIYRDPITKPMLAKIDGIVALANEIGEDKFIKWAIEQSYFFASDIVVERMDELIRNLANNPPTPLPARKTTKNGKDAEGDYRHEEIKGDKTKRIKVEWEENRGKRWFTKGLRIMNKMRGKNETLHSLYICFTFGLDLNGVWRVLLYIGAENVMFWAVLTAVWGISWASGRVWLLMWVL